MPFNITIDHATTAAPSVVSEGSDGAQLPANSTHSHHSTSDRESRSPSDQSDNHDDPRRVPLYYPGELHDAEELAPSDSASRPGSHRSYPRASAEPSRSNSAARRQPSRRQTGQHRDPVDYNHRGRAPSSPESVDSAEEYARAAYHRPGPPNRHSYYDGTHLVLQPGYAHSSSSGGNSYGYPPLPSNHVVPYAPQPPPPAPYTPQYGHIGPPPPAAYPPTTHAYPPPPISHHASGSHISSAYMTSPYAPPTMIPYQHGYFPPHYQQPFPQFMDPYSRVITPQHPTATLPSTAPATTAASAEPAVPAASVIDQEEVIKRMESILSAEKAERLARETAEKEEKLAREVAERDERLRIEKQKEADAKAALDQEEIVKRVEAMLLAEKEERLAREAKREADAKAAADEAAATAERAASDAKIAEEAATKAAAAAREEAEKKAAEDAAKAKEEAEAKLAEAQAKSAEAEAAAAKAKADAEAAEAKIPPPPADKKAPIRFKDAVGRKFNFPFHLCAKWSGMEELIRQAFLHVEVIGPHVQEGHYDLLGPNGEIILPQVWETVIEPDWTITMAMWPMPVTQPPEEPPEPPPPPSLDDAIINIEDILAGKKHKPSKGPGSAKSTSKKNLDPFARWLIGAGKPAKGGNKSLKVEKKPDVAAGSQRAAHSQSDCSVM